MFNNVNINKYKKHIKDSHSQIDKVQFQDQFELIISMQSPVLKSPIPKEIIKSYSFVRGGLGLEHSEAGSQVLNRFSEVLPERIEVTFYNQIKLNTVTNVNKISLQNEFNDIKYDLFESFEVIGGNFGSIDLTQPIRNFVNDLVAPAENFLSNIDNKVSSFLNGGFLGFMGGNSSLKSLFSGATNTVELNTIDYFFKVGNMNIVPDDGTMLLANDWYFKIEANALNANWNKKNETKNFYVIDGDVEQTFSTDGSMQEFTVSFKKHII